MLLRRLVHNINVYSGISPSLLASISMGANIRAQNQTYLVAALKKAGVVATKYVEHVMSTIDRKWFTADLECYNNRPTKISHGETMTDALTHAIILQSFDDYLSTMDSREMRVLDIGCGHGYLTFGMAMLMKNRNIKAKVLGIDIYQENVKRCREIQQEHFKYTVGHTEFDVYDVDSAHWSKQQRRFEFITCGFFVSPSLHAKIINCLTENSMGVWPITQNNYQQLTIFKKKDSTLSQQYIISTLFSEQKAVLDEETQKYFVYFDKKPYVSPEPPRPPPSLKAVESKKQHESYRLQHTTSQFKLWQKQFKEEHGRAPTLEYIRANGMANQLLQNLRKK